MAKQRDDEWGVAFGEELELLLQEFPGSGPKLARQRGWAPRTDVVETPTHVLVRFEIAGVRPDQVQLAYRSDDHVLSLRGVRRASDEDGQAQPHLLEIEFGAFERHVRLPRAELAVEEARTRWHSGLLEVLIPKRGVLLIEHRVTVREV